MTDEPRQLRTLLRHTGPVLLDFDGPVCGIFAGGVNSTIADHLRQVLQGYGTELPEAVASDHDPLNVLSHAATTLDDHHQLQALEDALIDRETQAARHAQMTAGAHELIRACHPAGPLVMVSNNSAQAIETYLDLHELTPYVDRVIGRPYGQPHLMKPHRHILDRAVHFLGTPPDDCVLIGDSVTDIEVARLVGTRSIGYAKVPDRVDGLHRAGADLVTESMSDIADALHTAHTLA